MYDLDELLAEQAPEEVKDPEPTGPFLYGDTLTKEMSKI